jgi:hypothetical protein
MTGRESSIIRLGFEMAWKRCLDRRADQVESEGVAE